MYRRRERAHRLTNVEDTKLRSVHANQLNSEAINDKTNSMF